MIRFPATTAKSGLPRPTIYWLASKGLFVRPVKIGTRSAAFPEHEVDAIVAARVAGASDAEIRALVDALHAARKPATATEAAA